jgi:hypothetical protein
VPHNEIPSNGTPLGKDPSMVNAHPTKHATVPATAAATPFFRNLGASRKVQGCPFLGNLINQDTSNRYNKIHNHSPTSNKTCEREKTHNYMTSKNDKMIMITGLTTTNIYSTNATHLQLQSNQSHRQHNHTNLTIFNSTNTNDQQKSASQIYDG